MRLLSATILSFILFVHRSDTLIVNGRVATRHRAGSGSNASVALQEYASVKKVNLQRQTHTGSSQKIWRPEKQRLLLRPHTGKGPEIITFGLWAKNFFGTDLKRKMFDIDIVLSTKWEDMRVASLVPDNVEKLTMAWSQALAQVWMPAINVSNRAIENYEIISSSVTLFKTGEVLRVERAHAKIMQKYKLLEYPFDTQTLKVMLASSKYMLDEVVLVPGPCGLEERVWGQYDMKGWKTYVYEDRDHELKKSRGVLEITLKRNLGKYFDDHLVPSGIILMISWAVWFFPYTGPFTTPRLVLSILALLQFTNLMIKSNSALPGSAPFNWNDLFNQKMQTLIFLTVSLNIGTEIISHSFEETRLARRMNHEAKGIIPSMSVLTIGCILGSATLGWMTVDQATKVSHFIVVAFLVVYVWYVYYKVYLHRNLLEEEWLAPVVERSRKFKESFREARERRQAPSERDLRRMSSGL